MNKYDDIKTLLFTNFDIIQSCEFLFNYLKNYCLKPYNREKIDSYYNNLSDILKRFLFISSEGNLTSKSPKSFQSLMQNLHVKNSTFEEFDILLNHFLIPPNIENEINFTSSIFIHNYGNTRYLFPLDSIGFKGVSQNILQYQSNLINNFGIFEILSHSQEEIMKYLDKKELILTIKEYFIFNILNFIKNSPNVNKIQLKDYYPNFKKYLENISPNKFYSKKTEFIINNFEKDRSIIYNFYNIFFIDLILYLNMSSQPQNSYILEILLFAIEFIWLGDFSMSPQDFFYAKSSYIGNKMSFTNLEYQNTLNNLSNYLSVPIPNILLLNCLKNIISVMQSKKYLFNESNFQGEKILILKPNVLLFSLQDSLFNFFKNGFSKFTKDVGGSEIFLSDFASVWYTYITPWESSLDSPNNLYFGYDGQQTGNLSAFNKKNISPLKKIFNFNSNRLIRKNIPEYLEYIEINLHFYTDLFQDYINAFSSWNILSVEELNILICVLDLYNISPDGFFINNMINYFHLRDFSLGTMTNFTQTGKIENLIRHNTYLKRNIFPFEIPENLTQIKSLIGSISNLIFKLQNSQDYRIEDTNRFINKLEIVKGTLRTLYKINENEIDFNNIANRESRDLSNIYDKRTILEYGEIENPWHKKIASEEIKFLFYILFYFSYFIDFIRRIPLRYNKSGELLPPVTNLRYLSNYYNLLSTIGLITILYFMILIILK